MRRSPPPTYVSAPRPGQIRGETGALERATSCALLILAWHIGQCGDSALTLSSGSMVNAPHTAMYPITQSSSVIRSVLSSTKCRYQRTMPKRSIIHRPDGGEVRTMANRALTHDHRRMPQAQGMSAQGAAQMLGSRISRPIRIAFGGSCSVAPHLA